MRKSLVALAIGALCLQTAAAQKDKESKETVTGNGKSVTRDVPVQAFSKLVASGVYELKLSQGDKESVRIEADENLQEYFTVNNEGDRLVIDMKKMNNKNMRLKTKMRVYVTFRQLTDVELSTVGNVKSEETLSFTDLKLDNKSVGNVDLDLTANKLNINNTSVGNVNLKGKAQSAQFINSGVGNLDAGDFVVQTMSIENTGVGNAEVNAEKECKVKDNMLGKVRNKGNAPVRKANKVVI
jgi:hypothetical protein